MEDRMAEMLLFMEKLPQELITDDINLSMMDISGDTHRGGASTAAPPPPQNPINYPFDHHSNTTPFPPLLLPQGNLRGEGASNDEEATATSMAAMREMIFRIAAMQPVQIDPESVRPPKRKNVRISREPQSVAARHRRERISQKIRILQRLVPGGTKMDTASMLDEAIHYVKFLKTQVQSLERAALSHHAPPVAPGGVGFPVVLSRVNVGSCFPVMRTHHGGFERHYYDPSDA